MLVLALAALVHAAPQYVIATGLNVRSEPSVTAPITERLSIGDKVDITHREQANFVELAGDLGWVDRRYLVDQAPTLSFLRRRRNQAQTRQTLVTWASRAAALGEPEDAFLLGMILGFDDAQTLDGWERRLGAPPTVTFDNFVHPPDHNGEVRFELSVGPTGFSDLFLDTLRSSADLPLHVLPTDGPSLPGRVAGIHLNPPTEDVCSSSYDAWVVELSVAGESLPTAVAISIGETAPSSWNQPPPPKQDQEDIELQARSYFQKHGLHDPKITAIGWGDRWWVRGYEVGGYRPDDPMYPLFLRVGDLGWHADVLQMEEVFEEPGCRAVPAIQPGALRDLDGDGEPEYFMSMESCCPC